MKTRKAERERERERERVLNAPIYDALNNAKLYVLMI